MALAYLLDPTNQYSNVAGVNNVAGWFEVFISDTPERADVYVDFAGTRAPERIGIDNDGRAVMIVDSEGVYRVEMHAPNGELLWTQYPVWPVGQGGGGSVGVDIGSSDGSVDVQRTQVGSVVNYDLSVAADSTDLLGWGEYVGYTMDGTHMVPSYSAGTIETGPHGIRLHGGQYYHVTVELGANSTEQNVYDAFQVSFKGVDGDGAVSTFATKSFHYDASTGEGHSYDVSFDMMPATDVELYAEATGLESGISVGISEVYVHRVYSGAPFIPETIADKDWVEENFQEKLTAGNNITIENNVISASGSFAQVQTDWTQSDSTAVDYLKHKPDLSVYATDQELTAGLATKQDTISDLATIRSGAAAGATALQPSDVAEVAVTGNYNDLSNKPSIPTKTSDLTNDSGFITDADAPVKDVQVEGVSVVNAQGIAEFSIPASGVLDVEVDGASVVNAQGVAEITMPDLSGYATTQDLSDGLADKQDVLTPGSNITITNNVISATASPQQQADWDQGDSSAVDYIRNKPTIPVVPTMKELVAGSNVTITESANSVTISADGAAQVQSDWAQNNPEVPSYIQNKPAIPVLPTMKELVAGMGVMITEGSTDVTISATGATYTAGTGIDITNGVISADTTVLALKSELPAIGTITL